MRGVPLTPDQIARAVESYARTGNYCETARALGLSEPTVRLALRRVADTSRHALHARAVQRGLRAARRHLDAALARAPEFLADADDAKQYAAVMGAIAKATEVFLALDARRDRHASAVLTRAKTRAEIALLARSADAPDGLDVTVHVTAADDLAMAPDPPADDGLPAP